MRQFTIHGFNPAVVLAAVLALATIRPAWAQSASVPPLPAPVPASPPEPQTRPAEPPSGSVWVMGGGDRRKVSVLGVPGSDEEVRVDEAGNLSLNLLGSGHVAGL